MWEELTRAKMISSFQPPIWTPWWKYEKSPNSKSPNLLNHLPTKLPTYKITHCSTKSPKEKSPNLQNQLNCKITYLSKLPTIQNIELEFGACFPLICPNQPHLLLIKRAFIANLTWSNQSLKAVFLFLTLQGMLHPHLSQPTTPSPFIANLT